MSDINTQISKKEFIKYLQGLDKETLIELLAAKMTNAKNEFSRKIVLAKEIPNPSNIKQQRPNRYKCLICGRDKFKKKHGHICNGQYRKRGLKWEAIND